MGIKELRDNNILIPFQITELETLILKPKEEVKTEKIEEIIKEKEVKTEKIEEIQTSNEPTINDIKNIEKTVKKMKELEEPLKMRRKIKLLKSC